MAKQNKKVMHEADSKGNLKFSSPLDMQEQVIEKAPESAMQAHVAPMESGTTEAEYQEPVDPVDPVDDYLQKTYPLLGQNIPNILRAILREIVIGRLK